MDFTWAIKYATEFWELPFWSFLVMLQLLTLN